jgi:hypothetical protein
MKGLKHKHNTARAQSGDKWGAQRWSIEARIAFGGLIAAFLGVGFTVLQMYGSRKHDRESTLPHLEFQRTYSSVEKDRPFPGLYVRNSGSGLAEVVSVEYKVAGRVVTVVGANFVHEMLGPLAVDWPSVAFHMIGNDDYIQPNETIGIIKLDGTKDPEITDTFNHKLQSLTMKISYRSEAGELFVVTSEAILQ